MKTTPKPQNQPSNSDLGRFVEYDNEYNPHRLYPIPRMGKRLEIGIESLVPPFYGFDCWNHYEVSWLNEKGKPIVAIAKIVYDCHSPMIVESKSLKLYFNSLNQSRFANSEAVQEVIRQDLERIIQADVQVMIQKLSDMQKIASFTALKGECLDELDVCCEYYEVHPEYLSTSDLVVTETLYSDLLKSNCLVTNQPDWGSVQIVYTGKKINKEGLLQYLVSFRTHNEFHEQCIERIYMDIMRICSPTHLMVYGRYTRRGGLDINPLRSSAPVVLEDLDIRLIRQ